MDLNTNYLLSDDEIDSMNLFNDESTQDPDPGNQETKEDKEEKTTENNVTPDELFDSESVGSEEQKVKEEDAPDSTQSRGSSPNSDFYYSIANALVEDGVLPDLEEEFVKQIKSPEDLAEAIEKQVNARLDETQRRVNEALQSNIEPDEIRQYENVLSYLDKITEDTLKEESEKGEQLRRQLIFQDLINRKFSKERAAREVKKSIDSGTDIEDAKDALESSKLFFKSQYEDLIQKGKQQVEDNNRRIKKEAEDLKKQMLEDKEIFAGISLDRATRQKAYDNISRPVYKTEDGQYITAVQKYQMDNPVEFRKKLGVIFTLTDGFNNLDMLVKGKVRKEVRKSLRELENTLTNTGRPSGNPTFVGNYGDPESYSGKGWTLDI